MKEIFITKLYLENVRNLGYVEIPLSKDKPKHLIFTGKNGSGKTTVLDALARCLDILDTQVESYKQEISIKFNYSLDYFRPAVESGELIIAYYKADRRFNVEIPQHVEKVELKQRYTIQDDARRNFVKYLLDLKMTQALAIAGNKKEKAQKIQAWFDEFENLLRRIFENNQLKLDFDEDTFHFSIIEPGKEPYDFNTLSSGYAAILDIVIDIMIRMERQTGRRFQYDLPGIVLIDEIETHLHLELQKNILDLLTTMFCNVQFIVSTHSPFILNSLEQVVIYDLEQKILVEQGLSNIPYEGIVEGYFRANALSHTLREKFERYKTIVHKKSLTDDDIEEVVNLEMYLDEIPDYLALEITTEYQRLKLDFSKREDIDG